jgi:fluoride exporter
VLSLVAVLIAGGLGAVSRAAIDALGTRRRVGSGVPGPAAARPRIPWPTTAINVTGSLAAGVIAGTVAGHAGAGTLASVLAVGYLGAFTTFSTAMLQTVDLLMAGARGRAVVHAVLPLVASVGAASVGWTLVG